MYRKQGRGSRGNKEQTARPKRGCDEDGQRGRQRVEREREGQLCGKEWKDNEDGAVIRDVRREGDVDARKFLG